MLYNAKFRYIFISSADVLKYWGAKSRKVAQKVVYVQISLVYDTMGTLTASHIAALYIILENHERN